MRFFFALAILLASATGFAKGSIEKGEYKGVGNMKDTSGKTTQYEVTVSISSKPGGWFIKSTTTQGGKTEKWAFWLKEVGPEFYLMIDEEGKQTIGEAACIGGYCEFHMSGGARGFRQESYKFTDRELFVSGLQANGNQRQIWRELLLQVK